MKYIIEQDTLYFVYIFIKILLVTSWYICDVTTNFFTLIKLNDATGGVYM